MMQLTNMIERVKEKRAQDIEDQTEFCAELKNWADVTSTRICANMNAMISNKSEIINKKFEEVIAAANRVKKLEDDLNKFKSRIEIFYKEANDTNIP